MLCVSPATFLCSLDILFFEIDAYYSSSSSSCILTAISYSTLRSYNNLLNHSQVDEHLVLSNYFPGIHDASVNIHLHVSLCI